MRVLQDVDFVNLGVFYIFTVSNAFPMHMTGVVGLAMPGDVTGFLF